jgi:uncharacterized protein YceK
MKKNTYVISGVLLLMVAVGASGCGSNTAATASTTSSSSTATQTTQTQSGQQNNQANRGPMASNPALRTVMEMRRLQSNTQMALTSDQKTKLKPIVQNLISTSNPTQDFLQQQADAMNALLTDQQKNFLKQRPTGQRPRNNNSNGNNSNNSPNSGSQNGNSKSNQPRPSFQPKDIYQQFLNSLN